MKFLLIVLAIHLASEVVTGKGREKKRNEEERNDRAVHPAEHGLRDSA
jgi:hypothetical protein